MLWVKERRAWVPARDRRGQLNLKTTRVIFVFIFRSDSSSPPPPPPQGSDKQWEKSPTAVQLPGLYTVSREPWHTRKKNTDLGRVESRSTPLQNRNSQIRRHPTRSSRVHHLILRCRHLVLNRPRRMGSDPETRILRRTNLRLGIFLPRQIYPNPPSKPADPRVSAIP